MKTKKIIYVLLISVLLFDCSSDSSDDIKEEEQEMNSGSTDITYNGNIKSIINNNCTQCHGSTPSNGAPFSLTTFDQVKGRVDRIIARTNSASSPMPPDGLINSGLRATIQQWKDDGLLEN